MEAKIRELEDRLSLAEASAFVPDRNSSLRDYQVGVLERLREIRNAMSNENSGGNNSELLSSVTSERDEALLLVKKQQNEICKLNYRINHLIKALNEAESKA
jgi:hypothetical protein